MRYDEEGGRRRAPGRWEPADDGECRRWHGDSQGARRRRRGRGRHFAGRPCAGIPRGPGFPGGPELHGFGPWGRERGMRGPRARRGDVRAAALCAAGREAR